MAIYPGQTSPQQSGNNLVSRPNIRVDSGKWINFIRCMAWIKLDCINQESTVITGFNNFSGCWIDYLSLPVYADDIYLAAISIHNRPHPTFLLRSVYRNIKHLTVANKTTVQDNELMDLDWDWCEDIFHQLRSLILHSRDEMSIRNEQD